MHKEVNFELAKSLKEKGFDLEVSCYYNNHPPKNGHPRGLVKGIDTHGLIQDHNGETKGDNLICSAPTIAEIVMWLYEKYGIWVAVVRFKDHAADNNEKPTFRHNFLFREYNSPTEAYEAAIEYTLKTLI